MSSQNRKVRIKNGKISENFVVHDLDDWNEVAEYVSRGMLPGSVVTLSGSLGAGKTTLVQYLARLLGAPKRAISPTFALMRIYKTGKNPVGLKRLVHVDAYRIEDEKDLIVLDLDEELATPGTALLIEWPDNINGWLRGRDGVIQVEISTK